MGKWEKSRFMGTEVTGKILGLIGCGNVGSIVAERAQGLKMRVIVYDPFMTNEHAADLGVERVELDILLARAHFISLHAPLTEATSGMIDAVALAKTQRGVRIINCARGGLILEGDLKEAIQAGQVAGAALDVFAEEPAVKNELFGMPEIIATPHLGAATNEAQEKVALQLAEQMSDYLVNGSVTNALNMPSVSAEEVPRLAPYMALAHQLGSFAGQITETGIKEVAVEYEGAAAALNTRPLTAIVLESLLLESVNMVNAPLIAKERDIEVREIKREGPCDYNSMIRLKVITETQTQSVAGTLFGERPRLTHIAGINIEAELGPHMLFVINQDKPGFIGSFGKTLGDMNLNIATFHLGRASPGAEAIALIEVDQPVTQDLLDKVQALPYVVRANALYFAQQN
jgi:D-3-phosphoglycerate dehydrogenase